MGKCCVCGEESSHLIHGLWWCEKHVNYVRGERKKPSNRTEKNEEIGKTELGLAWI